MKVILIEEERFAEIADLMKARATDAKAGNRAEMAGVPENVWQAALNAAHATIHYEFVRWAQSHGASCVRR